MKSFRQLGFLKLHFRGDPQAQEEDRVLNLFRNRAELKKAYGELQKEVYRLKDRIKQQEGATQRAQDMLATLEGQLAFGETAYPALVFYQLRRLWRTGRELIEQLVADLSRRQDQRERQHHFAEHHRRQTARLQAADQQVREAEKRAAATRAALSELEAQRARLNRLWHYFKRGALVQPIAAATAEAEAAASALKEATAGVEAIQKEPVAAFPGISVEARRAINLAAIAYAEALCARLSGTGLVKLARAATSYREVSDEYGSRSDCEGLMEQIERAQITIQSRSNVAQEIKSRTDRLRGWVRYRNPAVDTAPIPESLNSPHGGPQGGPGSQGTQGGGEAATTEGSSTGMPNVLSEDTWDLFKVLLR